MAEQIIQDGTVENPFVLEIPESCWLPTGDFNDCEATTRLSCKIQIAGVPLHVEAIQVYEPYYDDQSTNLKPVNSDFESDIDQLYAMACWSGDTPMLATIQGREYVILTYPFAH